MATNISIEQVSQWIEDALQKFLSERYDALTEDAVKKFREELMEMKADALVKIFAKVMENFATMDAEIQIQIPLRRPGMWPHWPRTY